jgi:predicted CoA-binding protein
MGAHGRSPADVLRSGRVVAVVGASRDPIKPGGSAPAALQGHGFRLIPINPHGDVIFGERVYKTLAEVPEQIDIVDVFRPSEDAPEIARQAVAVGARALWLQSGIRSAEARRIAEAGGLDYVEDRCISVERALSQVHHSTDGRRSSQAR